MSLTMVAPMVGRTAHTVGDRRGRSEDRGGALRATLTVRLPEASPPL